MPVKSVIGRGLIYAGETPLALTITVVQTGPMQLTVRAGSFTTTGQAAVMDYQPALHDRALSQGAVERIDYPARVCWPAVNDDGGIVNVADTLYEPLFHDHLIEWGRVALIPARARIRTWVTPPETFVLRADTVFDIAPNAAHRIDLVAVDGVAYAVLLSRAISGAYPTLPDCVRTVVSLTQDFTVYGVADELPDIEAVGVLPGFPAATEPEDWMIQKGSTGEDRRAAVLRVQIKALERAFARERVPVSVTEEPERVLVERRVTHASRA